MILCDNKKLVDQLTGKGLINADICLVNTHSLMNYSGSREIKVVIGSRALLQVVQATYLPALRYVQLLSVGMDGLYPKLFASRGVQLANAHNIYSDGMAEFVVYAILMHAKRYDIMPGSSRPKLLRGYKFFTELSGKTVGIMGVGNIGKAIAKRLVGFNMNIIGYANSTTTAQYFSEIYHRERLTSFCNQCDYIVSTLPNTEDTQGLIDASFWAHVKPTICFVNVGRKIVIDDNDFIAFLKFNKRASAILDMFEYLPLPWSNRYRRLPNVKILPGVTAISKEIDKKLLNLVVGNIQKFEAGEPLINIIKL
ncbi:hypothetical protein DWX23_02480 [Parabacteroides sp. AF18-52]|jgi:D-isomer specific 2-hydroxyacid dehydrogenase NAD-binding|uniref:NAD(P)-dependent oxidoreductase n=1 Tax=Parabacteroides sp. AF18-52 TaxID=2292242 RepID=UPI000EFEACAC|nr:NAD(P)-dependent oxidoreductase [Parabacteroides sp. AF18-52]RHR43396.1 hypothetical protein DWX23_02480 [Parabacteroides sp. AF18-52]